MIHVELKDGKILCEIKDADSIYEEMFALNLAIMKEPVLQLLWADAAAQKQSLLKMKKWITYPSRRFLQKSLERALKHDTGRS